jgi:large subunit ribosomal protein L23
MKVNEVIRKPVVTEKSTLLQEKQIYAFWVNPKATKIDVKLAVKAIYGADASEVKMVNVAEKFRKLRKGSFNKHSEKRKAYVTLSGNTKLDLNKFEKAEKETKVKLASAKKESKPAKKTVKAKKD